MHNSALDGTVTLIDTRLGLNRAEAPAQALAKTTGSSGTKPQAVTTLIVSGAFAIIVNWCFSLLAGATPTIRA